MNSGNWEGRALGYTTVEMLLDDVSKQMASSNLSRYSRGSAGQKTAGSMRIVKPNSASNSPRGSAGLGRRRTVMTDGAYRRRLAMIDQNVASGGYTPNDGLQLPNYTTRPVSWHPSSHLAPQPNYQEAYPFPAPEINNQFQIYDLPPTPAVYSGYTSPSSTFSPLSLPYSGYEQVEQQTSYHDQPNSFQTSTNYITNDTPHLQERAQNFVPQSNSNIEASMYSHFDWNNFAVNGFENSSTAPPTPENFLPIQHPEPTFPAEESIPYHPLSDDDDGEELIGMGLYDAPEPAKALSSDPQLDSYRTSMMSHLLGASRREPTGKGLKLEETWNPPPSDDEDDEEEDDDEQDGEGESDDEDKPELNVTTASHEPARTSQTQSYDRSGWL
ncbi:hypothetical protein V8E51_006919 [Hyaloscypha variabilis]